jgi:hypothetical protein
MNGAGWRSRVLTVCGLMAFVFDARSALAQYNTAEIAIVVRDSQGGVLPGVSFVATHVASGLRTERVSDQGGRIFLPALPPGDFTITAELSGFRQFALRGLTLQAGQKIELPVTLEIGQLADSVTVTADAPLLRAANAEIAEVIDTRQVQLLPLNGRQFIQLAQLTDGVAIAPGGTRGAALGQTGPGRTCMDSAAATTSTCSTA